MSKNLVMTFLNEEGKKCTIRVNRAKEKLTREEVHNVMDTIISKNIFFTSGGNLKSKNKVEYVQNIREEI